jgi:uncharacterized protein (DUF305 family)
MGRLTGQTSVRHYWRILVIVLVLTLVTFAALAWAAKSEQQPGNTPVAIGFLLDMSVHHNQAITMAMQGAVKGTPEIRSTALKIIQGQSLEMGMMQAWSMPAKQYADTTQAPMMGWMADRYARLGVHIPAYDQFISACLTNPTQMPGMASLEDLQQLQKSVGREFNRLWLQLMIRHHEAAMVMIQFASEHAETVHVRNLASGMLRDQVKESAYLLTLAHREGFSPQAANGN